MTAPQFILIAGPNGSGKTTSAPAILPAWVPFLNADEIAGALNSQESDNVEILAGRLLVEQWDRRERRGESFAVEATLASRSLSRRIARLRAKGYQFHLIYFWLESPDLAIARVLERVRRGGHDVPSETVRRRYTAGVRNLFEIYLPLADRWRVHENTRDGDIRLVAEGAPGANSMVYAPESWQKIREAGGAG